MIENVGNWEVSVRPTRLHLAKRINEVARLSGSFTLRSGQESSTYFDKYLFEADPLLMWDVAWQMQNLLPDNTEVLAGLELGGVPLAVILSNLTGIPAAFVRKQAKEYGTCKLAEGAAIDGKRVVVIEDVITTGGQVLKSVVELRELGAIVTDVVCVINRSGGVFNLILGQFEEAGLTLHSVFTMAELDAVDAVDA